MNLTILTFRRIFSLVQCNGANVYNVSIWRSPKLRFCIVNPYTFTRHAGNVLSKVPASYSKLFSNKEILLEGIIGVSQRA